jgi:NAD(P)H-dependent FMN reductase
MTTKPRLHVIAASTRPGRRGIHIARWFHGVAQAFPDFDVELVDLQDFALPVYDEPRHPKLQQYEHEHTKRWSASVAAADAFVIVTPEYNFTAPPALFNALQYLYTEWNYKPVGFVSYGFGSGGLRAVQEVKTLLTTLKTVPLVEQVMVPMFEQQFDAAGNFVANALQDSSAQTLLTELSRWTKAMTSLRQV